MAARQISRRAPTDAFRWSVELRHRNRQPSQRLAGRARLAEVVAVRRLARDVGRERRQRLAMLGLHSEKVSAIKCREWSWQREGDTRLGDLREHIALEAQPRHVVSIVVGAQ